MFGLYRARNIEEAAKNAAHIHAACFPQPWDAAHFKNFLDNPTTYIFFAREGEEDVATILFQKVTTEAEILTFGVLPRIQREGIGSGLLWFAEKALEKEGCTRFFLEVSDANLAARNLYNKLNYKEFSIRKNYYPDGSHAVCMEKQI